MGHNADRLSDRFGISRREQVIQNSNSALVPQAVHEQKPDGVEHGRIRARLMHTTLLMFLPNGRARQHVARSFAVYEAHYCAPH